MKKLLNSLLTVTGYELVRSSKLQALRDSERKFERENGKLREIVASDPLTRDADAHAFRLAVDAGPREEVPTAYLNNLRRASLTLRDVSAENARLRREIEIARAGIAPGGSYDTEKVVPVPPRQGEIYRPLYHFDGLRTDPNIIHNHDFMRDPRFVRAYNRATAGTGIDQHYYWRAHQAIWCASLGLSLEGDFVECGVWKGLLSTSIMAYFDWNTTGRKFFLFDTFRGVDESQLTAAEVEKGAVAHFREMYKEDLYEQVVKNFSAFKNVTITRGLVPDTLPTVKIDKVSYLSIDMNNVTPEIAAINYFWDRLVKGAPVLLDDYGFINYEEQKHAFDAWARDHGVQIFALPTGQGLIIKP